MGNIENPRGFVSLKRPILRSLDLMQIDVENGRAYIREFEEEEILGAHEHIGSLSYCRGEAKIYIDVYATEDNHLIVCVNTKKADGFKEHRRVLIPLLPL